MARFDRTLAENEPGAFFVDSTCIDCDTCRLVAPSVFGRSERAGKSYVHRQPRGADDRKRALMSLVACPTASIGTTDKTDVVAGVDAFPERIEDDVYFCGFTAESSFGAWSYLVRRPEGNVLVDSPRAAGPLLRNIERLGGVRFMVLTHRDDVADHAAFRKHFGCERVMHRADLDRATAGVERIIDGENPVALAGDLRVIPVPGHTRGSIALLYREHFLFTGDHMAGREDGAGLEAWPEVCWYSWPALVRSTERLHALPFHWVLPGHGRPFRAESAGAMHEAMGVLIRHMHEGD